jgi:DNA repair photolyase
MQTELFGSEDSPKKQKLGHSSIQYKEASSILTKTSGFMEGYDYSMNPYSGCSFGCTYCYAAFFARDKAKRDEWGYWVEVKENALALLKKKRKRPLENKTIYLSSVTDPYQPIERDLELTRELLIELATYHKTRLVIQTRSQLVTRDIDILKQFEVVQVNMTITTDSERVRKTFEPFCPSNKVRLKAIQQVHEAGIQTCITMTPLLPVEDAHAFAQSLQETGIPKFIIQPFHADRGKFVAGTRDQARELLSEMNWTQETYQSVRDIIKEVLPQTGEGKEGFSPI